MRSGLVVSGFRKLGTFTHPSGKRRLVAMKRGMPLLRLVTDRREAGFDEILLSMDDAAHVAQAIQVDGGSEFMAEFEQACEAREIALYVLPPRSPKLNGRVERLNGTCRREFWECYDGALDLPSLQAALRTWEVTYNTERPHQSLGYLTPAAYLATLPVSHVSN